MVQMVNRTRSRQGRDIDVGETAARADDASVALLKQAGLDRQIAFILRIAQLAVFDDLAKRIGPLNLTLGEFGTLRLIEAQPALSQQQISDALRIKKSNLGTLIGRLERSGLVARAVAAADRRAYALRLTQKGVDCLRKAEQQCAVHAEALSKLLEAEEEKIMLNALQKIAKFGLARD